MAPQQQHVAAHQSSVQPKNQPKILRIGVIQGGKIIEEKLLRKRQNITIGTTPKNTISIPASSLPRSHTLFEVKAGQYTLAFTDKMNGRVSVQNGVLDFPTLKSKDFVKRKGSVYYLQLNDASRGKVTIGDVTMLFQFVVPPPMPEKPRLPATARGSLVKTIDWFYAGLLAVSAVIHIGIVVVFYNVPQPEPMDIYEMDNRWAELIVPELKQEKKKPKKPKADKKPTGKGQKIQKAEKAPKKPNKSMSSQERKAARAARRAKAREMIAGKGVLAVLGTKGAGGAGGVVADVFGEGGIGVNEGAFDGIQGVGVADGAGQRTRRGASDVGKAAGIGDLATEGGGNVSTGKKREMKVGVVKSQRPEVDGDLDPKAIARIVRARLRSIQMCYERELKRNPNLAGKISIEFTIETNGRVSDTYVVSNSMNNQAVANCIQSRIRTWVFPRPKGGSVTVAYPFIFSPAG